VRKEATYLFSASKGHKNSQVQFASRKVWLLFVWEVFAVSSRIWRSFFVQKNDHHSQDQDSFASSLEVDENGSRTKVKDSPKPIFSDSD
jgi:hypothetical protein